MHPQINVFTFVRRKRAKDTATAPVNHLLVHALSRNVFTVAKKKIENIAPK